MTREDEYRVACDAQTRRYEAVTGLSILDMHRQEYRDYFGVGDYAGAPVEKGTRSINGKRWSFQVYRERSGFSWGLSTPGNSVAGSAASIADAVARIDGYVEHQTLPSELWDVTA